MESLKVRRTLCKRRPEHFYQDFLKLMIFCPKSWVGGMVLCTTKRRRRGRKCSLFKNEKKENSIKHVFRAMFFELLLLLLLLHVFVVVQKLTIFS
jgi:hypothetical protein